MADTISRVDAAIEGHLQYIFGLGVGLGLGRAFNEWQRLRRDLTGEQLKQIDRGYDMGMRDALHN